MLKKYPDKINLVIKHYPLRMHKFARRASLAALAAAKQDKYTEFSKALFDKYNKMNDGTVKSCAEKAGLDIQKFDEDLKDPSLNKAVTQDIRLAKEVKVSGVPAIFINGRRAKKRSLDALSQMVEQALKTKKE